MWCPRTSSPRARPALYGLKFQTVRYMFCANLFASGNCGNRRTERRVTKARWQRNLLLFQSLSFFFNEGTLTPFVLGIDSFLKERSLFFRLGTSRTCIASLRISREMSKETNGGFRRAVSHAGVTTERALSEICLLRIAVKGSATRRRSCLRVTHPNSP